jgi:hypothetical protein
MTRVRYLASRLLPDHPTLQKVHQIMILEYLWIGKDSKSLSFSNHRASLLRGQIHPLLQRWRMTDLRMFVSAWTLPILRIPRTLSIVIE